MTVSKPTVLAFERKLENSDALMFAGNWQDIDVPDKWQEIKITDRRNRAVKGHKMTEDILNNPDELQKEVEEANLAWGDDATLPHSCDTLKVSFTLRVLGDVGTPSACNKHDYQEKLQSLCIEYREQPGFATLARRYAINIVNGRFLWRNRVGAELIRVSVRIDNDKIDFDAYEYSLQKFNSSDKDFERLAANIEKGLAGQAFALFSVDAFVKLGAGQRVWPSQEMVLNPPKGEKSRHLFQINGCAAMHSQKIGNALRTIDTWYRQDDNVAPIAAEPYGSVTHRGQAYRTSRNDFYTLSEKWIIKGKDLTDDEKHFVMAVLVRGGVFGESGK